jgi:dsDNA-specific endonuclease/ATPase MutS2
MSSEDNDTEIADIIAQLQQLQLQQSILLTRLARSQDRNTEREYLDTVSEIPREFQIGDRVRIINPTRFQQNKGVVVKITEHRVSVKPQIGINISRSPHNLILEN